MIKKIKYNFKKSFTLFEVLVSLVILSVTIGGIIKIFNTSDDLEIYYQLIDIENNFEEFNTVMETNNIKFTKTTNE